MSNVLSDYILDNGLTKINSEATDVYLCSQDPTTYTEATSTYALGKKTPGAGSVAGAPAPGTPNGRKVTVAAIAGGSVSANGTAAKWAVVDATNSRLHANGSLAGSQVVTSGNTFNLAAFDIGIPGQ